MSILLVFSSSYKDFPATRGGDTNDYTFSVWVCERFLEKGDPPEEWIDERKFFVERLYNAVSDARTVRLLETAPGDGSGLWPEITEVSLVLNADHLSERKECVSVMTLTFREIN